MRLPKSVRTSLSIDCFAYKTSHLDEVLQDDETVHIDLGQVKLSSL
jgi:hypothetical protein